MLPPPQKADLSTRPRRAPSPPIANWAALAGCLFLAACADTESHRIETCTNVAAGLHVGAGVIDIVSTTAGRASDDVRVTYRLRSDSRPTSRVRWIVCHFERAELGDPEPDLVSVDTPDGPLGDGRLFVLQRWWLQSSFAGWQADEG